MFYLSSWSVEVRIVDRGVFLLDCHSWSKARDVAEKWEREHGPNTTAVYAPGQIDRVRT